MAAERDLVYTVLDGLYLFNKPRAKKKSLLAKKRSVN